MSAAVERRTALETSSSFAPAAARAPAAGLVPAVASPALARAPSPPAIAPAAPSVTPPPVPSARPVVPAAPSAAERFREAQAALAGGRPDHALELFEGVARGQGPTAENAAYWMGTVLRDHLRKARQAVGAWNRYRARFPRGILRAEADLSIIETLLALGDSEEALAEADAFLLRHPDSERRAEVARLVQRLQTSERGGRNDVQQGARNAF
jgi:TolA-binding protein